MAIIQGTLRADRRTKDLVQRLKPGDVALIHHLDLDSTAARSLVDCRVGAVVNAAQSISGRYPNQGPAIVVDAGIPLIDAIGEDFFALAAARDGMAAVIDGDAVRLPDGVCAVGKRLTAALVANQLESARANLDRELEAFAQNTLAFIREEKAILLDPVGMPEVATAMRGKPAVVVVRGEGYKEDLGVIAQYVHDMRPVLIGVDGGADALLETGLKPHLIIGDMDSVSDAALKSGAELIVHGYARGEREAPGLARVEKLGLQAKVFHAPGTSEDIAILLADEKGASLIVAVGTHFSLVEFLDKGRGGMASTFLVRLRTGSKLVDAKGIARLWDTRPRIAPRDILIIVAAALFPIGVIAVYSPWFRTVINTLRLSLRSTFGLH
jgi:uncharacterized membrane-anchored protein